MTIEFFRHMNWLKCGYHAFVLIVCALCILWVDVTIESMLIVSLSFVVTCILHKLLGILVHFFFGLGNLQNFKYKSPTNSSWVYWRQISFIANLLRILDWEKKMGTRKRGGGKCFPVRWWMYQISLSSVIYQISRFHYFMAFYKQLFCYM